MIARLVDSAAGWLDRWCEGRSKALLWIAGALLAWLLLSILLLGARSALAADCARVGDARRAELLALAAAWTGLPQETPPPIVYWPLDRIRSVASTRREAWALAVRTPAGEVIVLPCLADAGPGLDALLLHEIVHSLQRAAGADPTTGASEWQAERLQRRLLERPAASVARR